MLGKHPVDADDGVHHARTLLTLLDAKPEMARWLFSIVAQGWGSPDKEGPLEDNCRNEGGSSISRKDGPQEQHSCQIVVVGQLVVVANPPVQRHDDEGQRQLVHNARPQKGDIPEVLGGTPLYNRPTHNIVKNLEDLILVFRRLICTQTWYMQASRKGDRGIALEILRLLDVEL